MENNEYDVKLSLDLEKLSKFICKQYKFKNYQSNEIIYEDYDNFTFSITCEKKKYFVRFLNKRKEEKDIQKYVDKYRIIQESFKGIPRILKQQQKEILKVVLDNGEKVYVKVMEFIPGHSLLQEKVEVTKNDIDQIVKFMDEFKKVEIAEENKELSFPNLRNNLKKYNEFVPSKWNQDISLCLDTLKQINYKGMKKQTIHGDLHLSNIISNEGKLTFVDYDYACNGYRLIDVVKVINNVIFTIKNKKEAEELYDYFLEAYQKNNPLTEVEKKYLNQLVIADCYNNLCLNRYLLKIGKNKNIKYWYKNDLKVIKIFKKKI